MLKYYKNKTVFTKRAVTIEDMGAAFKKYLPLLKDTLMLTCEDSERALRRALELRELYRELQELQEFQGLNEKSWL